MNWIWGFEKYLMYKYDLLWHLIKSGTHSTFTEVLCYRGISTWVFPFLLLHILTDSDDSLINKPQCNNKTVRM